MPGAVMPLLDSGAISAIEAILKNKGIAEVKYERGYLYVVEISRKVKYPLREDSDGRRKQQSRAE